MAALKMTDKDIEKLETINQKLEQLARQGDVKSFFRVHNEFHELFIRAAGNEKLTELIDQLVMKFNRSRMASLALPGRMEISVNEHRKIIQAFRERDSEQADNLVKKTAAYGAQVLIQSIAQAEGRQAETSVFSQNVDV